MRIHLSIDKWWIQVSYWLRRVRNIMTWRWKFKFTETLFVIMLNRFFREINFPNHFHENDFTKKKSPIVFFFYSVILTRNSFSLSFFSCLHPIVVLLHVQRRRHTWCPVDIWKNAGKFKSIQSKSLIATPSSWWSYW